MTKFLQSEKLSVPFVVKAKILRKETLVKILSIKGGPLQTLAK